jgi:hypothetical protein
MKTLGLAFVIVAIVGFIVYLLFGYLLKAEGLAGAFAGLVFGTLPFIHQELEKRAAKKAVPAVPPAQMPNAAQSFQPPANAQSPSAPDWWQVSSGQATPPLSQSCGTGCR